jgi:hypothetical protein
MRSDIFLIVWTFIWIIGTNIDFSFSLGEKNSIVVETKKEEKKPEVKTDDFPKSSWSHERSNLYYS